LTGQSPILRGRRGVAVGFLAALAVVSFAASEADARRYARHGAQIESDGPPSSAIVVDANSGEVLHSSKADELRHPASLTKIMTLYLLFERLDAGKLKLDTPLSVSEHAADQAPTKLGLKADQTIAVEDAIKGLVTRSANDAAVVIAEAVAGDERSFAELMTRKARALGMNRTVYRNASGLPSDEQVTTARDQAALGRAIQERFPRYYTYFSTVSFNYHGQSIRNHNQLLGRVEGVDGIKTGYTQASGYNLVTSLRRGNKHLVAVVLGGSSAGSRDAKMRNLIDEYIQVASSKKTAPAIAEAPMARETVTAQARPAEVRPSEKQQADKKSAETKTADARAPSTPAPAKDGHAAGRPNPAAVYAVASYSQPIPWPSANAPTAAPAAAPTVAAAPVAAPAPTPPSAAAPAVSVAPTPPVAATAPMPPPAVAPTAPASRLSAAAVAAPQVPRPAEPAGEPIKPIPVKTVKVKLAPTRSASIDTPPPVKTVVDEPAHVRGPERAAANVVPVPAPAPERKAAVDEPAPVPARVPERAAAILAPPMPAPAPPREAVVDEPTPPAKARTTEFPIAAVPAPATTPKSTQRFSAAAPAPADEEPATAVAPPTRSAALANAPAEALPLRTSQSENAVLRTSQTDSTVAHAGWIIQVGAYDNESDAKQRLTKAQAHAASMLSHADPFTEPVVKGDKTLYRARFAGLQKDQAEAVCKQLKRNDIDCMTIRN
jgi:D-alanyl-D-alanine carboxypeptidase